MTEVRTSPRRARGTRAERWADLGVRVVSGLILAGLGAVSVRIGGGFFLAMTILIFALMAWELAAMTDGQGQGTLGPLARPALRLAIAGLAALGILLAELSGPGALGLVLAPLAMALSPRGDRRLMAAYMLLVLVAAKGFIALDHRAAIIVVWLVCIVVASDVFGYFAGRMLGGPKFWPTISPKKTWSGTVAGWLGTALVGAGFAWWQGGGWGLVAISPLVGFAGQMGDLIESAIKRRAGVKDASRLIPGHGGVLDRFDALIGAVLAVMLIELVLPLPLGIF